MRKLIIASAVALAGCATTQESVWVRSGATERDYSMDRGQCRAQAIGIANVTVQQATIVFSSCMEGKGWTQEPRSRS